MRNDTDIIPILKEEIKITPEMVDVGLLAYSLGDTEFEPSEEIVVRIYRAMRRLEPRCWDPASEFDVGSLKKASQLANNAI